MKVEVNLSIDDKDIALIKDYLEGKLIPVKLYDLNKHVAFFKTQNNRKNKVRIYNPNCEYKVGDLVYKEYHGKLPIGSKKNIELNVGVVLKVYEVKENFGLNQIKLEYEGTSLFRKYTEYLYRQKIDLLLPHKQKKPCEKVTYLPEDDDPRNTLEPLIERDFNILKKKLVIAMRREPDIDIINDRALSDKNLKKIESEVFGKIREFLTENKSSETTEFLVETFLKVKSDDKEFEAYCFALNYRMETDYKIDFQLVNLKGWGKWNLISVIYYLKKNSLISEENPLLKKIIFKDRVNISNRRKKLEESIFNNEPYRYFLTEREICSGALRLKTGIYNFGDAIEIEAIDINSKKSYILFYYNDGNVILGLRDLFDIHKVLQGTSLVFEQLVDNKFQFNIRTSKKGTIADKIIYDNGKKAFKAIDEKIVSPVFVNKSIFLESDIYNVIYERIDDFKKIREFNKLIHKVFIEFGIKEKNYEIHILKLYHILDLIFPVYLKTVEEVILSNPEFIPSEKMPGVFYLDSDSVIEIEEEEKKRRVKLIDEKKKKREEVKREEIKEELREKDEIRLKREERRRKREGEMMMKERMMKEREERKKEKLTRAKFEKPRRQLKPKEKAVGEMRDSGFKKEHKPKDKDEVFKRRATVSGSEIIIPLEKESARRVHAKKLRKKIDLEKPIKTKKIVDKRDTEEAIDLDEIKKEIKLEKLKEKVSDKEKVKVKTEKRKKVVYKDNKAFGSVFASKLDEVVKKQDEIKVKKKEKKTKK